MIKKVGKKQGIPTLLKVDELNKTIYNLRGVFLSIPIFRILGICLGRIFLINQLVKMIAGISSFA